MSFGFDLLQNNKSIANNIDLNEISEIIGIARSTLNYHVKKVSGGVVKYKDYSIIPVGDKKTVGHVTFSKDMCLEWDTMCYIAKMVDRGKYKIVKGKNNYAKRVI